MCLNTSNKQELIRKNMFILLAGIFKDIKIQENENHNFFENNCIVPGLS